MTRVRAGVDRVRRTIGMSSTSRTLRVLLAVAIGGAVSSVVRRVRILIAFTIASAGELLQK